jgi:hypothetical protein
MELKKLLSDSSMPNNSALPSFAKNVPSSLRFVKEAPTATTRNKSEERLSNRISFWRRTQPDVAFTL